MKNKETILSVTFGLLGLVAWYFPNIELTYKIIISTIGLASIGLILIKEHLSYFFRKFWPEITIALLLTILGLIFWRAFPQLLVPAIILVLASIIVSQLISFKYGQTLIYKTKELFKQVTINDAWVVNHWQSNCARIENEKMVFSGTQAPNSTDGSHINLINALEVGKQYEITCFAKSEPNTTGLFQLWCHDQTGKPTHGVNVSTSFKTPSTRGETVSLIFNSDFNEDIRIHLQYTPGLGKIEISDVKIFKLKT